MGLGPYPELTLAAARGKALEIRRKVKLEGRDPLAERRREEVRTFRAVAEALIASKRDGWRNARHRHQWASTLETHVYPTLGDRDVREIDTPAVLAVLRPIWSKTPETASRVRGRIEAVLDYATAMKARTGANPAQWKGNLAHLLPKARKVRQVVHHPALDWRQAPAFMAELAKRQGVGARALAFAIMTAARSGEVRGMTWAEVDDDLMVWTVPAARMKAGREHRIPLTPAARALLGKRGAVGDLVFPSPSDFSKPLNNTTMMLVLHRMKRDDLTVHGCRSTFRDWAGEVSMHPREVIEHALAHKLKDKAEASYARGDLFTKRRALMKDWSDYLARPVGDVIAMPAPWVEASA